MYIVAQGLISPLSNLASLANTNITHSGSLQFDRTRSNLMLRVFGRYEVEMTHAEKKQEKLYQS